MTSKTAFKIISAMLRRWGHCLWNTLLLRSGHREETIWFSDSGFNQISCECGKVFWSDRQ